MKPFIEYSEAQDPNANSYQAKRDRKSKNLISEERQGHLNQMKKSYKTGYHEKELIVPPVKLPCPESFIQGPDTLNVGETGIFSSRTNESFNSFDIQSAWRLSTPANMGFDQRVIDSIPPYEGKLATPKRFAKDSGEKKWAKDSECVRRWAGDAEKKWSDGGGEKKWEGQQKAAEDTGTEEGFCRAEYKFNNAGLVRIDATPILPGVDKIVRCAPKHVKIIPSVLPWIYWTDDFNDNSLDTALWHTPVEKCFALSEEDERFRMQPDSMNCANIHFDDTLQSKCPNNYFTRDYWQATVGFKDFTGDVKSAYLLYRYGSGASAWRSVEFYHDISANQVKYRWGTEGSWSYSTGRATSFPESDTLKIRRNGNNLEFWNGIDSQWESEIFTPTTYAAPVYMGILKDARAFATNISVDAEWDGGMIRGYADSYAVAHSTHADCYTTARGVGQQHYVGTVENSWLCYRQFLRFDTALIPDEADITNVYLRAHRDNPLHCFQNLANFDIDIYKADWASNLCDNSEANYDLALSAALDAKWLANVCNSLCQNYNSGNMSNSYINKTGDTKYALVSSRDKSASNPGTDGTTRTEYAYVSGAQLKITYYYGQASFDNLAIEAH